MANALAQTSLFTNGPVYQSLDVLGLLAAPHGAVNFTQIFVRTLLGQVFDKTFFMIVALTGWDYLEGLREYRGAHLDRAVVLVAAIVGLAARVYNLSTSKKPQEYAAWWQLFSAFIGMMLAVQTRRLEIRTLDDKNYQQQQMRQNEANRDKEMPTNWAPVSKPHREGSWSTAYRGQSGEGTTWATDSTFNKRAPSTGWASEDGRQDMEEDGSSTPREKSLAAASYGSFPMPAGAAAQDWTWVVFRAFFNFCFVAVVVYAMEAEDKMINVLQEVSFSEVQKFLLAAVLGTAVAASLAVILGFSLENAVQKDRYLFALCLCFTALSLVSLTQGLAHVLPAYIHHK
mmetsp:Transcript_52082/g.96440  ORF Transcript_52082/g.96440 Transcript_52082/m.96440 type:complete len:343 (+) Transcript_52082:121-1149(+)